MSFGQDEFRKEKKKSNKPLIVGLSTALAVCVALGGAYVYKQSQISVTQEAVSNDVAYETNDDIQKVVTKQIIQYFTDSNLNDYISDEDMSEIVNRVTKGIINSDYASSLSSAERLEVENLISKAVSDAVASLNEGMSASSDSTKSILTNEFTSYVDDTIVPSIKQLIDKNASDIKALKTTVEALQKQLGNNSSMSASERAELINSINELNALTSDQKTELINIINKNDASTADALTQLEAKLKEYADNYNMSQTLALATAKDELNTSISDTKDELSTEIATTNQTVSDNKTATDEAIQATNQTVSDNKTATDSAITTLSNTVADNKTDTDAEIAELKKQMADLQALVEASGDSYVGMIIYSSTLDTMEKVIDFYGGTTWQKIEGVFLLGESTTYPINTTGGEATHTLTIAEMPSHAHSQSVPSGGAYYDVYPGGFAITGSSGATTGYTGGNQPHNNMPPYRAVYIWERTE